MKSNLTEIVFIIDRSGSMAALTKDTVGGFNTFIDKQKLEPGEAVITTILFDDKYEVLHNCKDIKEIKELTDKVCYARGGTALLDAIGKTINIVGNRLNNTPEDERPSKVIFVITTDGEENASTEFTVGMVKDLIKLQTETYSWEFLFLGANIDAIGAASSMGISNASNYTANSSGTYSLYNAVNSTVATYRNSGIIEKDWNKDIQ